MKLSVIVNNYNYEVFVARAIESALAQTWQNTEVLVVDDGSTDNSREVIESFGERVITVYKENGGQGSAFTAAVPHATGDVFIFLDADDILDATTGEEAVRSFQQDPELARVQWPLRTIDEDDHATGGVTPNPSMMPSGDLRRHIIKYRTHVWPATSGNAYRGDIIRKLMPVPKEFRMGCDLYFAEVTALYGTVHSIRRPGGGYRNHGANYWMGIGRDLANLHQRIAWTVQNHENVRKACAELGVPCPPSAMVAHDVAFVSQRLASLRLEPSSHPIPGDKRSALVGLGILAAVEHPHHSAKHKMKRVLWLLGTGFGPDVVARRLIDRFYFPKSP